MAKTSNGKIQNLLEQAAAQAESDAPETSSVSSAARAFQTEAEAEKSFSHLHEKLFRINRWNSESGISSFALYNENGEEQPDKRAVIGDFIKITLPGSGKDDWVKIIAVDSTPNEIVLSVRPSYNPTGKEADKKTVSHFFTDDSTNNFCLQREDAKLSFYVIGLSEKSNTSETGGVLETVRNFATANAGHYLGIQKAQWQIFCDNFLKVKESEKEKKE